MNPKKRRVLHPRHSWVCDFFPSPPPPPFVFLFAKFTPPLLFACPFLLFVKPFEGLGIAANVGVSTAATFVVPSAPIIAVPGELSFSLFHSSFLPRGFVSFFFFNQGFSFHALCFFDRSTSYGAFLV